MSYLPCVEIEPTSPAKASVIWLHGLGANGHDFEPIVPALRLDQLGIRYVFPHAPSLPITINGGFVMPAWYDILEMDFERKVDLRQLLKSSVSIRHLIEREIERGVPSERIILIGFSQGGAVALQTALTFEKPLAGLLGLSTYFASHQSIAPHPNNKTIPIHIYHGTYDSMVPEALGQQSHQKLVDMGYQAHYQTFSVDHSVCPEEVIAIAQFIHTVLTNQS